MRKPQKEIQLTSYNELLGIDDSVNPGTDRIVEIPISDLASGLKAIPLKFWMMKK